MVLSLVNYHEEAFLTWQEYEGDIAYEDSEEDQPNEVRGKVSLILQVFENIWVQILSVGLICKVLEREIGYETEK
jgi:hypothetical protein